MTDTTAPQTVPDPGPGYRLLQDDEIICFGDERMDGSDLIPRRWLNVKVGIGMTVADYRSEYSALSILAVRRKVEAPQPEPPAKPMPVAPTKPGLYPLADGSTVYLVGPDYAGDWVGMWGDYARCWRHDGSGRAVPAVTGPRIPEPVDPAAAIACVNELIAADRLEWHIGGNSPWTPIERYFACRLKRPTISPPPDDWPPEIKQAAIDAATKLDMEVAE